MVFSLITSIVLVLIDQLTKIYISSNMTLGETRSFVPFFDLYYIQNTGAAFSILSTMTWLLGAISVAFCVLVIVYFIIKKPTNKLLNISLVLIFSGALGNAIDRIFYHYVIDFIQTNFMNFATFNVADMYITIGAVLLIIYVFVFDKDKKVTDNGNDYSENDK